MAAVTERAGRTEQDDPDEEVDGQLLRPGKRKRCAVAHDHIDKGDGHHHRQQQRAQHLFQARIQKTQHRIHPVVERGRAGPSPQNEKTKSAKPLPVGNSRIGLK